MDPEKRWLTLAETASYLSVPISFVYKASSRGDLPGKVKLMSDRVIRVDRFELDRYLEAQKGG